MSLSIFLHFSLYVCVCVSLPLALRQKLNVKLLAWSGDKNVGTLKKIRPLLSSLHTVLWEGARWKQVSLGDILEAKGVKKAYVEK